MPELIDGQWVNSPVAANEMKAGAFHRAESRFRDRVSADGADAFPAAAGRYQLFVSLLCPWASRSLIFRGLKGLQDLVQVSYAEINVDQDGWVFPPGTEAGPHFGPVRELYKLYTASDAHYTGKVSVPVLWDRERGRIVNNEPSEIIRMLNGAFDHLTGNRLDRYPAPLRPAIDHWNAIIYPNVNNGVYRTGFAKTQESYEEAFDALFATLDQLEAHLGAHRYLAGEFLTEADWRLFVTLIRFDAAYHGAFKCNLRRIVDYPALDRYVARVLAIPGARIICM